MTNYGIIGCGMMGHEHLRNISLLEGRNIAAIYEPDRGMAASAFRVVSNAIVAKSINDLLAVQNLDCFSDRQSKSLSYGAAATAWGITTDAAFRGKATVYRSRRSINDTAVRKKIFFSGMGRDGISIHASCYCVYRKSRGCDWRN